MPNLDHTGPDGQGSQTGKKLGICNTNIADQSLGHRLRQHTRGRKSQIRNSFETFNFEENEIIGMKRCKHKHH